MRAVAEDRHSPQWRVGERLEKLGTRSVVRGGVCALVAAACALVGLAGPVASSASAQPAYTVVNLGTLPGGSHSGASAINDNGEVVGYSEGSDDGNSQAFAWTPSGGMVGPGVLPGYSQSWANAISDNGEVVGYSAGPDNEPQAFAWTPSGGMVGLGVLPGYSESIATGVNDQGEVVGYMTNPTATDAFTWTSSGGMVDLGALLGATDSVARGVNDNGEVVGQSTAAGGVTQAFAWTPSGGAVDIVAGVAWAVNNNGEVVGSVVDAFGNLEGFAWTPSGGIVNLGSLADDYECAPSGVNNNGEVVGTCQSTDSVYSEAFVWTPTGGMVGLLAEDANSASGVNDNGVVAGGSGNLATLWWPNSQSWPPFFTSFANATFAVGDQGTFTITAYGNPVPALSETGTLPPGVTFVDNGNGTATLSGVPAAATGGAYPFTLTANNGVAPVGTQAFTLTVDQPPAITSAAAATARSGVPFQFQVTTTGYPSPTLSEAGTLPSGLSFTNNGNGTATIAGTPASTGAIYAMTIKARNGVTPTATQDFSLTVDAVPAITSPDHATATVGALFSFKVTTTGYPAPKLSGTGELPPGLNAFPTGGGDAVIAGTPRKAGTYTITITASNGVGKPAAQILVFNVVKS